MNDKQRLAYADRAMRRRQYERATMEKAEPVRTWSATHPAYYVSTHAPVRQEKNGEERE